MLIAIYLPLTTRCLNVCGTSDVFAEANLLSSGEAAYNVRVISETTTPITCISGLTVLPDRTIYDPDEPIDTLIVAGSRDSATTQLHPVTVAWVQRQSSVVRRYGSICGGAFILGAAGLLDGKRVTTHWEFAPALALSYPSAIVQPDRIFVRDGPLFTSAGAAASIDLALALVEEDHGRALALAVARRLVVYLKRPGDQPQISVHLAAQIATRTPIESVHEWIRNNPQTDLSIANLARHAGMSQRTFSRVFRSESGMTPAGFVELARVEMAQRLLEDTNLSLQRIAAGCGFMSVDALRRAFRRRRGLGLLDYRSRFRAVDPSRSPR
jgi:transcriptional regulator GlxA family with amidase domain